jgi:uncharacterized protein YjbJ (UPF0337 family)
MEIAVNKDILQGKWKQLTGKVKQQWSRLTDDELGRIQGRYDELVGVVQERYGYSREKAAQEVDDFIGRIDQSKFNAA